jgi:DNA repair protein RecO (recombination protein O)
MTDLPRTFRVEAVVLRHTNFGEADRYLVLFTRQYGKLKCVARGIRKIKSRKAGHLEPFTLSSIQLSRGHDAPIITQAETIQPFQEIHASLDLLAQSSIVIELLDRFTFEEEENQELFTLLVETLKRICAGDDIFLAVHYYEMSLLKTVGFRPELFHCVVCRKEILAEDQYFSAALGGVVCPTCANSTAESRPVSMEALKYLRHLQRSSYPEARKAHPVLLVQREMDDLLQYYLSYLLERGLNSPKFLREIQEDRYQAEKKTDA